METVTTTNIGNDTWQWNMPTKQHNILSFLWSRFIKASDDSITDYQNETKIDERVIEKTSELNEENHTLQSKVKKLEKGKTKDDSTIQGLRNEIVTMR